MTIFNFWKMERNFYGPVKKWFNSIYIYSADGKELLQLTPSSYDVLKVYGIDAKNSSILKRLSILLWTSKCIRFQYGGRRRYKSYYSMRKVKTRDHFPTFEYYTWIHSTINTPPAMNCISKEVWIQDFARKWKCKKKDGWIQCAASNFFHFHYFRKGRVIWLHNIYPQLWSQ